MASCKCCILYDICEKKDEEICKGTRVRDLEHNCIDYFKLVEIDVPTKEVIDKLCESDWSRVNTISPEQLREILKEKQNDQN